MILIGRLAALDPWFLAASHRWLVASGVSGPFIPRGWMHLRAERGGIDYVGESDDRSQL